MNDRVAIVGCGKQKLDTDTPVPIARLYTSTYFELKREYALTCCDQYFILSAEHGLLPRDIYVTPYDTTIDDLDEDELAEWVDEVAEAFEHFYDDEAVVLLAGQSYLDPLDEPLTDLAEHTLLEFPFSQTSGIGEQMRWLKAEIARVADGRSTGQSSLEMYSGGHS